MQALLLLYCEVHLFGYTGGLNLLRAYGGLVYSLPLRGLIADRWLGMRRRWFFAASCSFSATWAWLRRHAAHAGRRCVVTRATPR